MNQLEIFKFNENEVRTILLNEEPWFVLKDVCDVLEISNPTMVANRLDDDERTKFNLGRQGEATIINESGMYNVILRSDKPQAKPFRKWVTSDVLPTIRKHGAYMTDAKIDEILSDPDTIIKLATDLKNKREQVKLLEAEKEILAPKAFFADSVGASKNSVLIKQLSVILKQNGFDIGQNRLFSLLREEGYLIKQKGNNYNLPTQKSLDLKVMEIKYGTRINYEGTTAITQTTMITGKGQIYFVNRYLKRIKEKN